MKHIEEGEILNVHAGEHVRDIIIEFGGVLQVFKRGIADNVLMRPGSTLILHEGCTIEINGPMDGQVVHQRAVSERWLEEHNKLRAEEESHA